MKYIEKYIPHEKRKIIYTDWGDERKTKNFIIFDGTVVSEGGWFSDRKWMTAKELNAAQDRWVANCYKTGKQEPDVKEDWIPHQCGGCRWFAAFDLDYGICCNKESPNDGRITFEHGGCTKHSDFQEEVSNG